jgi:hypothetical protein
MMPISYQTTSISGTVSYSGTTGTFTPASALAYNTNYAATITTGARDLAGNAVPGRLINLQAFKVEWTRKKVSLGNLRPSNLRDEDGHRPEDDVQVGPERPIANIQLIKADLVGQDVLEVHTHEVRLQKHVLLTVIQDAGGAGDTGPDREDLPA